MTKSTTHVTASATIEVHLRGEEWVVHWPNGEVTVRLTPEEVIADVRARDARATKRDGRCRVTRVEWCGVPDGWSPPP